MAVKFPKRFNLRFTKQDAHIYNGLLKSAKENPSNRHGSLTEEIMIAGDFYLRYKDRVNELEETKQS